MSGLEIGTAWPLLVILGCLSGFLSGLLGIGGGTVIVPALIIGPPLIGIDGPEVPKIAMATSLATIIPTSLAGAQTHAAKGAIDWPVLAMLAPVIIAGSMIATTFAQSFSSTLLCAMFVAYALCSAFGLMRKRGALPVALAGETHPGLLRLVLIGTLAGCSSLLGLGVAFFAVPVMSRYMPLQKAIGTATLLSAVMAISGVAGHLSGDAPLECRSGCTGYIYLPAVAAIGMSGVLIAPLGARIMQILPVLLLRRLFGCVLIAAAVHLAVKGLPLATLPSEAGMLLARIASPAEAGPPFGSAPPYFLSGEIRQNPDALIAEFGPRQAFLPLAAPWSTGRSAVRLFVFSPVQSLGDTTLWVADSSEGSSVATASTAINMPLPTRRHRRGGELISRRGTAQAER